MLILEENGLGLKKINSESDPIENNIMDIKTYIQENFNESGFVVAYLDYKVLIGKYESRQFVFADSEDFESRYVQKIRVFSDKGELFIWRSSDGFKGRLRKDEEGENTNVVDAKQVLFGTKSESLKNEFTKIFEYRGTELILPFADLQVDDKENRVFLKTRNYIDYNEAGQATYVDCRFIGFLFDNKDFK